MAHAVVRDREPLINVPHLVPPEPVNIRARMGPPERALVPVQPRAQIETRGSPVPAKHLDKADVGAHPVIPALDNR